MDSFGYTQSDQPHPTGCPDATHDLVTKPMGRATGDRPAPAAEALWVADGSGDLIAIDARTNSITARSHSVCFRTCPRVAG